MFHVLKIFLELANKNAELRAKHWRKILTAASSNRSQRWPGFQVIF